jgi:hypothetical protein
MRVDTQSRGINRSRTFRAEIVCLTAAVIGGSACLAGIVPDYKCIPIAAPVTTCGCPVPGTPEDRCEGSLPKAPSTCYGDVMCMGWPGQTCITADGANSCGRVVHCPCDPCVDPDYCLTGGSTCACTVYDNKPPCTTTWGSCVWP